MEKKELPKKKSDLKEKPVARVSGKLKWLSNKALDIIKLILGVCFLPFVYSSSVAFLTQISRIDGSLQNYFWVGSFTLLIIYLFIWEPAVIYDKGHKLLEVVFNFFEPLVKVAPYLLPIYSIVLFILYLILALFIKEAWLLEWTMFLFGASLSLHLIFSSKSIRSKKGDLLQSNYIFGFSFVYIITIGLFAFFLSVIFKDFSFVRFSNDAYSLSGDIFKTIFSQLFVVK
ncbi:MAG: hypothetical protein NTZ63_03180 [Candidatus Omnitrophica bacterium]|nr:hypothetical protein [Candidatus Omnitrophota bacterium]